MPRCLYCCKDYRTRRKLAAHFEKCHHGHVSAGGDLPLMQCVLEVISNRPRQVLFCPHPYCLFMVKHVASTQMIARHFSEDHPDHELILQYKCDICNFHIDPAERFEHNRGHMNYESRGECIDSVVPQINPVDSSLDFVNISLLAPEDSLLENDLNISPRRGLRLAPTPPYRLPSTQSSTSVTASPPVPPSASIGSGTSSNLVIESQQSVALLSPTGSSIGGFLDLSPDDVRSSPPSSSSQVVIPSSIPSQGSSHISPSCSITVNSSPRVSLRASDGSFQENSPKSSTSPAASASSCISAIPSQASVVPNSPSSSTDGAFLNLSPAAVCSSPPLSNSQNVASNPSVSPTPSLNYSDPASPPDATESNFVRASPVSAAFPSQSQLPSGAQSPELFPSTNERSHALQDARQSTDSPSTPNQSPAAHSTAPSPPLSISPSDPPNELNRLLYASDEDNVDSLIHPVTNIPSSSIVPPGGVVLLGSGAPPPAGPPQVKTLHRDERSVILKAQDSRLVTWCSSPTPPEPGDRRCVILRSPSVVDVSSQSDDDMQADDKRKAYVANCMEALRVLKATFRGAESDSPPPIVDVSAIRGSTNSSSEASALNDQPVDSASSRSSPRLVTEPAAPLPIVAQIHPTRGLYHPASHRPVIPVDLSQVLQDARGISPPPSTSSDPVSAERNYPDSGDDDAPIPLAQPHGERPPDNVPDGPQVPPPPPADVDRDDGPHDTSDDLLLPDEDLDTLNEFQSKWVEVFNLDHSWEEFCGLCEQFATECRDMAQYLNQPKNPKPKPAVVPPPPPRRPPNGRPFRRFNPVEARRIQGLYQHSKKRAARKLLSDVSVSYSGSLADAEMYFEGVLSEKQCNTNLLCEALRAHVPNAEDEETTRSLKDAILESEVAAKLRSASNTAPGAD